MMQEQILLYETLQGIAHVRGVTSCLLIVMRECFSRGAIAGIVAMGFASLGQLLLSHISWPQIIAMFPLVVAFVGALVFVDRCFGRELWVIPHNSVVMRRLWQHRTISVETIAAAHFTEEQGRWAILEIVQYKGEGVRHIHFVTDVPQSERVALIEAIRPLKKGSQRGRLRVRS